MTNPSVFELSDRFVGDYARTCPVAATMAGVPGVISAWDDYSPDGASEVLALCRRTRDALPLGPEDLATRDGLATRVLRDFLDERIAYYESGDHLVDLNNIESPAQHVRTVFDVMGATTEEHWAGIARRLEGIGSALESYGAALEVGLVRGPGVSSRQVRAVIEQMATHARDDGSFHDLASQLEGSGVATDALRSDVSRGIAKARAATSRFAEFLKAYLPRAREEDAVGRERYVRAVDRFMGAKLDLEETYRWGFEEIRRIESEMRSCAREVDPGRPDGPRLVAEVVDGLARDPARHIHDREEFLRLMRERQERALADLAETHFEIPDRIRAIDVRLAPKGGPIGAYYIPPNEDFTRPGTVFYSPADGAPYTLFNEITTAYHEGFPGHHLQCGLQVHFADSLSRFHRLFVVCSGYAEGWALYAESLMAELGYFERPEYLLGMHMAKLFRACRVVADIGAHLSLRIPSDFDFHPGETWTWDLVADLLCERGLMPRANAESEATRYLGWPAQAISYKVGERVILDLREELRRSERFNLRRFHEAVLSTGSVGLDLLRARVRATLD
jgi:uncharacterized protein (DUF885 family)